MNENKTTTLTKEIYEQNKDNDKFLTEIAHAHGVQGWENENKALCYYTTGTDYKVSEELQKTAKQDYALRKKQIINSIENNELVFVGMGMDFDSNKPNQITNHRIRTYLLNNEKKLCFVEFCAEGSDKNFMHCSGTNTNTKKDINEWKSLKEREATEKRIPELEKIHKVPYTKKKILELVNHYFNCSFDNVRVISYCLNCDDYTSISKKKAKKKYHTEYITKRTHPNLIGKKAKFKDNLPDYTCTMWNKTGTIIQIEGVEHIGLSLKLDKPTRRSEGDNTDMDSCYIREGSIELL